MPPDTWIRHVAASESTPLFATGLFEREVTVWDFARREKISCFQTRLDFGGTRLALLGGERPLVIVGAYQRGAVRAYDPFTAETVWHREDLHPVQVISASEQHGLVAVGLEGHPLYVLKAHDGETVCTIRGAYKCLFGRSAEEVLIITKGYQLSRYSLTTGERVMVYATGGGTDIAAQSSESILTIHSGSHANAREAKVHQNREIPQGNLICFTREGKPLWTVNPLPRGAYMDVSWCEELQLWFAIQMSSRYERTQVVKAFHPDGTPAHEAFLGDCSEAEFFLGSRYLITSDGQVLELPSLKLAWQFRSRD